MRFKKLELLGFKSFAEPTELLFEPGVTAIVGPNGCGKSNIADAIKWVLGEQSARELRGGQMGDLIFNGSDRREPINYAEVSLTLDNSDRRLPIDYTEVTISRRLFRSGESEYLLNRSPVRLKDIQQLLMGTGIGTSAYSLFEQGRIEQIINARPEDRRAVFEEAAGITKFKSQKRETLRRLDETEDNLTRVTDVIAEVKRHIQAIERQVRRAKNYREQFEQLKRMEISVARFDTEKLTSQWQEKQDQLESLRQEMSLLEANLSQHEARLNEIREGVARADQAFTQAREALLKVTHRQETEQSSLQIHRERIQEAQSRHAQVHQEQIAAERQLEELRKQRSELATLVTREETDRVAKEEAITQHEERLDGCARIIQEAQDAITKGRERLLESTGQQVQVKNTLSKVRQDAIRLEARASRLQMEGSKVAVEREEAFSKAMVLEEELNVARERWEATQQEQKRDKEKLVATETSLEQARQEMYRFEQEVTRVGSKLEILKGLVASHEGYSSGVKTLLTALDEGRLSRAGVSGVLAELIQIGSEEMAAMDAALGSWTEAVVVDSDEVAERCRRFLQETQAGRVLFLIRNRVPMATTLPGGPDKKFAPEIQAIPLIDRLGITPHLAPLLKFLVGDTWFVETRESALALLKRMLQQSAPNLQGAVVTCAGEFFTVAGALLGSPPREEGMIIGRTSRLQSLEVAFCHGEKCLAQAQERFKGIQGQHEQERQALIQITRALQEQAQELERIQATHASEKTTLDKLDQERELLRTEQEEVALELKEASGQVEQWEGELSTKDEGLRAIETAIHQAQETTLKSTQAREATSVELATARAQLASFEEVASSRRASLKVLEQSTQSTEGQLAARRQELSQLVERQKEWEIGSQTLETSLLTIESDSASVQARVRESEGQRAQVLTKAQSQEKDFLVFSREIEQSQGKLHRLEMEQAQLTFQRQQINDRLTQVYQMNLEEPSEFEQISNEGQLQEIRSQAQELSAKLQRMGPVNLGSIDEERELQTRYEFLTTQQNDLLKAKEDLHTVITKINRTTRTMFRETFQAIQREFQITFKALFQGGEARLVLVDEEDVLESGIEIIARPPGKPLQTISLLSGGEKALTTIALLFAIFRIKPSPFCLLDEIDAPLDESNVDRFTTALREFLKESQFIIITHNKKTITMADVMYGVTMEEHGVSKIVSVKLKQKAGANGNGSAKVHAGTGA